MMKRLSVIPIALLLISSLALYGEGGSVLNLNVKEVIARLQDLALYPNLSKKRLYGAITKGGAIRFDLRATEAQPQSVGIGIAGDGTLREWQLTVYNGEGPEDSAQILRREKVTTENQWVFELLAPPEDVVIEIRNISSTGAIAVVEVVYGFYYGYSVDKENNTKPVIPNPAQKVSPTDTEKLSPIDTQNRVEFFRTPITKD
jgi:hypothetical protein